MIQYDETHADEKDIRGTIPSNMRNKFIKWFNKGVNRECSIHREYNEELILTIILPKDIFENPEYKYICTDYKGIKWCDHYNIYELLRFDIYEVILNNKQKDYLRGMKKSSKDYILATKEEIDKLGVTEKSPVASMTNHTKFILDN